MYDDSKSKIVTLMEEKAALENETQRLNAQIQSMTDMLETKSSLAVELNGELNELSVQKAALEQERIINQAQLETLGSEVEALRSQVKGLGHRLSSLSHSDVSPSVGEAEREHLAKELCDRYEAQISELQQQIELGQKREEELLSRLESMPGEQASREEREQLAEEVQSLRDHIQELDSNNQELLSGLQDLTKERDQLIQQLANSHDALAVDEKLGQLQKQLEVCSVIGE